MSSYAANAEKGVSFVKSYSHAVQNHAQRVVLEKD